MATTQPTSVRLTPAMARQINELRAELERRSRAVYANAEHPPPERTMAWSRTEVIGYAIDKLHRELLPAEGPSAPA